MKKVYSSISDIAHLWANQSQDEARTPSWNFYFDGTEIMSYGRHFIIAKHVINEAGTKAVLFTTRGYSSTTSKHINAVGHAANHLNIIRCFNPRENAQTENFSHWTDRLKNIAQSLERAKKPEIYLTQMAHELEQAKKYAEFFSLSLPAELLEASNIASKAEFLEYKAKQEAHEAKEAKKALKAQKIKHSEELTKWKNFEKVSMYFRDGFDYLRYNEEQNRVETSQGIRIPAQIGKMLYHTVKKTVAAGGCKVCNFQFMDYVVKEINKKFIQVGCHKITLIEIQKIATLLNW